MSEVHVTSSVQWRDEMGRFAEHIEEGAKEGIAAAAHEGAFLAAVFAPKRTLRLAGSIDPFTNGLQGGWTVSTPYAMDQEEGAGPHEIGRPGQILSGDGFGPVKGPVMHPGNPAVHYMKRAYAIVAPKLIIYIGNNI